MGNNNFFFLVKIIVCNEPDFTKARKVHEETKNKYITSHNCVSMLSISNQVFQRVTGTILVIPGARRTNLPENTTKINIGLQMKFTKGVSYYFYYFYQYNQ